MQAEIEPAPKTPVSLVVTEENVGQCVHDLEQLISLLDNQKNKDFATSLCQFYRKKKYLTEKQSYWVGHFIKRGVFSTTKELV